MIALDHLSFSALNDAEQCLSMFHARRVVPEDARVPEMRNSPRDRGTLIHKMRQLFLHATARNESRHDIPQRALEQEPQCAAEYEESVQVFQRWTQRFSVPAEDLFAVERFGSARIDGVPLPIIGYDDSVHYDRDNLQNVIQDGKTGWDSTITPDNEFQLDLSALRFEAEYGDEISLRTEIDFMRSGVVKTREWNAERKEAVQARVRSTYGKLEAADKSGEWEATPGSHCGYCPIAIACAERKLAQGSGFIVTDRQSAEDAVKHRILFTEAAARLTGALRPYVDANGPVVVGRVFAGFVSSETHGFKDVPALLERLTDEERVKVAKGLKLNGKLKMVKELQNDPRVSDLVTVTARANRFTFQGSSDDLAPESDEEIIDDA
jgi:hypothetical protein